MKPVELQALFEEHNILPKVVESALSAINSRDEPMRFCRKLCGNCDSCGAVRTGLFYALRFGANMPADTRDNVRRSFAGGIDIIEAFDWANDPERISQLIKRAMVARQVNGARVEPSLEKPLHVYVKVNMKWANTFDLTKSCKLLIHVMGMPLDCGELRIMGKARRVHEDEPLV